MKVALPLVYHAEVFSRVSQDWRGRYFLGKVDLELREYLESDVEVAVDGIDIQPFDRQTWTIWKNGTHWLPDTAKGGDIDEVFDSGCGPRLTQFEGYQRGFLTTQERRERYTMWLRKEVGPFRAKSYTDVRNSTKDDDIRALCEHANNYCVVNGFLHRKVATPSFRVDHETGMVDIGYGRCADKTVYFRLDRADDLRMYLEEHYGDPGPLMCSVPEVIKPDVCEFDDEAWSLADTAALLLPRIADGQARFTDDLGVAFYRLRGAARAMDAEIASPSKGDDVAERLRDLAEAIVQAPATGDRAYDSSMAIAAAIASRASSRWQLRPMLDEDFGFRPLS